MLDEDCEYIGLSVAEIKGEMYFSFCAFKKNKLTQKASFPFGEQKHLRAFPFPFFTVARFVY